MRRPDGPTGPVLAAMGLLASAGLLVGGFWFAHKITDVDDGPTVGLWADDNGDRLRVVVGDPGSSWDDLAIESDTPVRFSLGDSATRPAFTPVPVTNTDAPIIGGQDLHFCAVGGAQEAQITVRDGVDGDVVFQQTMGLEACR